MRTRSRVDLFVALNILVSLVVGGLVLIGSFVAGGEGLVRLFGSWAVTITVFALLLGFANVLRVHLGRIAAQRRDWPYSAALVFSALAVLVLGFAGNWTVGDPAVQWIFQWVYQPIGASLFALLAFFVISAAFRVLRAGPSAAWVLLIVALLVIAGDNAWGRVPPLDVLGSMTDWIMSYPALAGLRGLMLGSALGAVATSLRLLLGVDRPYMS
jgi:hypothetical protein